VIPGSGRHPAQGERVVEEAGEALLVGDHDALEAALDGKRAQPTEGALQAGLVARVEPGGRLVEAEQPQVAGEPRVDRDPEGQGEDDELTAREPGRRLADAVEEPGGEGELVVDLDGEADPEEGEQAVDVADQAGQLRLGDVLAQTSRQEEGLQAPELVPPGDEGLPFSSLGDQRDLRRPRRRRSTWPARPPGRGATRGW